MMARSVVENDSSGFVIPYHGGDIRRALKAIALPISPSCWDRGTEQITRKMRDLRIMDDEQAAWLALELAEWRSTGKPSQKLRKVLSAGLAAGTTNEQLGKRLAQVYWDLHRDLRGQSFALTFDEATTLLSHSLQIARLADEERLSSTQIATVISAQHSSMRFVFGPIQKILEKLAPALARGTPRITGDQMDALWDSDRNGDLLEFGDADTDTSIAVLDDVSRELGFPGDMQSHLRQLSTPRKGRSIIGPYFQMLYYVCMIAEHYDHPVSIPYEFTPRGEKQKALFLKFPGTFAAAREPFLNNAKAAYRLDYVWASTRDTPYQAQGLVRILDGLENMSHNSRSEMAAWLRRWVHRIIRLETETQIVIPDFTRDQIDRLLAEVSKAETHTAGVIEQRVVDAIAYLRHSDSKWQSRGLGDPVNAPNLPRRKLGDCDFQSLSERRVASFEAHAGNLTQSYIESHLFTLDRVLPERCKEWPVDDEDHWGVDVKFIAHSLRDPTQSNMQRRLDRMIDGFGTVMIDLGFVEMAEFLDSVAEYPDSDVLDAFNHLVVGPMNERRTPNVFRQKLVSLAPP